jgi:(S)-ureidoglycine aminohydrolase
MKRTSSQSLIPVEKKALNPTDYDMVYKAHDKGGVRQLFDRPTTMLNRFDIHITSLDPGISSHAPHTHKNEEIILMIDDISEMQLGEGKQKITSGDAAFVTSNIPHNYSNLGSRPAVYFAIQWN